MTPSEVLRDDERAVEAAVSDTDDEEMLDCTLEIVGRADNIDRLELRVEVTIGILVVGSDTEVGTEMVDTAVTADVGRLGVLGTVYEAESH